MKLIVLGVFYNCSALDTEELTLRFTFLFCHKKKLAVSVIENNLHDLVRNAIIIIMIIIIITIIIIIIIITRKGGCPRTGEGLWLMGM